MEAVPNGEQYSEADDKDSHKPNINHGATGLDIQQKGTTD